MRAILVDCEETILREIANPEITRRDVAQTYALILESHEAKSLDWGKVNGAIMARWSKADLIAIKQAAWNGTAFGEFK